MGIDEAGEEGRLASGGYDFGGYKPGEEYLPRGRTRGRRRAIVAFGLTVGLLAGVALGTLIMFLLS